MLLGSLLQVADLRVDDSIWEIAHVLFQLSVHCFKAPDKKLRVLVGGTNSEPLIDASVWIGDEVRKRLVEGPNRLVDVLTENEERVD